MLDLGGIDVEEIAAALADQTDYAHRWLLDPRTGQVAFWTSDTGIDGVNPVEIDELDLIPIDPIPSYVWYRDRPTSPKASATVRPDNAWRGRFRVGGRSVGSRTSSTRTFRSWSHLGRRCETPGLSAARSTGSRTTGSSTTTRPRSSRPTTQSPGCRDALRPKDVGLGAFGDVLTCRIADVGLWGESWEICRGYGNHPVGGDRGG